MVVCVRQSLGEMADDLEKFKLVISEDGINLHSKHASTLVHIKGR